jgi:hypothetical protein
MSRPRAKSEIMKPEKDFLSQNSTKDSLDTFKVHPEVEKIPLLTLRQQELMGLLPSPPGQRRSVQHGW